MDGLAVSGATSSTYSFSESAGLYYVTCEVTDSAFTPVTSPASNQVAVSVNSALTAPTVTPTPTTIDQGQTSTLSSTAVSTGTGPYTYQWLEVPPNVPLPTHYLAITGATSPGYSFPTSGTSATGTWSFELQVTDNVGAKVTSTATSVTVNADPSVTVSPVIAAFDVGQSQVFTASASGGSGSYTAYQWYVNGAPQPGQTASTFSYSPGSPGSYLVAATVSDSSGTISIQSNATDVTASVTVIPTSTPPTSSTPTPTTTASPTPTSTPTPTATLTPIPKPTPTTTAAPVFNAVDWSIVIIVIIIIVLSIIVLSWYKLGKKNLNKTK